VLDETSILRIYLASCHDIEPLYHLIGLEGVYTDRCAVGHPGGATVAGAHSKQSLSGPTWRLLTPREVTYDAPL
jgi:hypothetical protein